MIELFFWRFSGITIPIIDDVPSSAAIRFTICESSRATIVDLHDMRFVKNP
jgi:hypothetical protein